MNGCAISALYICVILPAGLFADIVLGGSGIFSALGIIGTLVMYGSQRDSGETQPAPAGL